MATVSARHSRGSPAGSLRPAALARWHPLWLAFTLTAVATVLRLHDTVDSDVAWQLWIAHHIHAGANLYTDIIEVNPPLWFWMALPIDQIATLLHLPAESVLIAALGAATALSVTAANLLIDYIRAPRRAMFIGYAALILLAMPWTHVGQREQIVLIGTLPYASLLAARRQARQVPPWLAFIVGIGFALGVALKHYFLLVPALLEMWLIAGNWRSWRCVRPETIAIVSVGAAYAAAVLLFEPDFIRTTIPMVRLAYGVTGALSIRDLLGPYALTALFIAAFALAHGRLLSNRRAAFASALMVSALSFAVVYFIQGKGWAYHTIPMLGCASLALAALLAEIETAPSLLRVVSPALLALPFLLAADDRAHPLLPNRDLINAVDPVRPGEAVGFLTVEPAVPWSITLQRSFRYPSRYMGYWMMRAVVDNQLRGGTNPRLTALGKQVVSETASDYLCTPPVRIVVAARRWAPQDFDILAFFDRDPGFASLFSHYRLRSSTSLDTYELASPLPAPTAPCRHGV